MKTSKFKGYATNERVSQAESSGGARVFMITQFLLAFCFAVALMITSGYYLFNVEENAECVSNDTDVARRFRIILIIYFTIGIVDTIRSLFVLLAIFTKKHKLAYIH